MLKIKRAYKPAEMNDGYRILVDRIWPRGVSKEHLQADEWNKEIAPSNELRKLFHHDTSKFTWFKQEYMKELDKNNETVSFLRRVESLLKQGNVTLVYGAKDEKNNQAVVLKEYVENALNNM